MGIDYFAGPEESSRCDTEHHKLMGVKEPGTRMTGRLSLNWAKAINLIKRS